jgi:proline iminopeptidase
MFSPQVMFPQMATFDLTKLSPDFFHAPIFFFEGRVDPYCRASDIADYIQTINAPKKDLGWFANFCHFPFFEEKQKFVDELVQRVLPLVNDPSGGN